MTLTGVQKTSTFPGTVDAGILKVNASLPGFAVAGSVTVTVFADELTASTYVPVGTYVPDTSIPGRIPVTELSVQVVDVVVGVPVVATCDAVDAAVVTLACAPTLEMTGRFSPVVGKPTSDSPATAGAYAAGMSEIICDPPSAPVYEVPMTALSVTTFPLIAVM